MRSLLRFLARNHFFLLFLVLEIMSLTLVVQYNNYQNVKFFNSSTKVVARIYETINSAYGYFRLHQVNSELAAENAKLKNKLQQVTRPKAPPQMNSFAIAGAGNDSIAQDTTAHTPVAGDTITDTHPDRVRQTIVPHDIDNNDIVFDSINVRYRFIPAEVIDNSVNRQNNYITINKGKKDGIKPEMGLVGPNGIVGIITNVSEHYATGQTVLNRRWRVSAKIKNSNYFGSLVWDGLDYRFARLNEIPFHVELAIGDTIITSGYSSVFPAGIMIGQIENFDIGSGDNFYEIGVRLSTNFKTLTYVEVVQDKDASEIKNLKRNNLDD
jgi:rod shape-determining protein MreC